MPKEPRNLDGEQRRALRDKVNREVRRLLEKGENHKIKDVANDHVRNLNGMGAVDAEKQAWDDVIEAIRGYERHKR